MIPLASNLPGAQVVRGSLHELGEGPHPLLCALSCNQILKAALLLPISTQSLFRRTSLASVSHSLPARHNSTSPFFSPFWLFLPSNLSPLSPSCPHRSKSGNDWRQTEIGISRMILKVSNSSVEWHQIIRMDVNTVLESPFPLALTLWLLDHGTSLWRAWVGGNGTWGLREEAVNQPI